MKIIENNVKGGKIVVFDNKFYEKLQSYFQILSLQWDFVKTKFVLGAGVFEQKI